MAGRKKSGAWASGRASFGAALVVLLAGLTFLSGGYRARLADAVAQTSAPIPDVNCDDSVSAADYSAAVLVSFDENLYPDCEPADDFRGRPLIDEDFEAITREIYNFFDEPFTPTVTFTPGSPTLTRTPTQSRTPTQTRTRTTTPATTPTRTQTITQTRTRTSTRTATQTSTTTRTVTRTTTPTPTQTLTPSASRTPTGLAHRLSGEWFADWGNTICFLDGTPNDLFPFIPDVVYRVTAENGRLDIETTDGAQIGSGLPVAADGTVDPPSFRIASGRFCQISGRSLDFEFDYRFTFGTNGFGTASVEWSFGEDSFCAVCTPVLDSANLQKISGP